MVALVTRGTDDMPLAIHRTFLAPGCGGKAPVDPQCSVRAVAVLYGSLLWAKC